MYSKDGFWINADAIKNPKNINDVLKNSMYVSASHIVAIYRNPELFDFSNEEYREVYKRYGEKFGLEGKARELIVLIATCVNNWIRIRGVIAGTGIVDNKIIQIMQTFFEFLKKGGTISTDKGEETFIKPMENIEIKHIDSYEKTIKMETELKKEEFIKNSPDRYKNQMSDVLCIKNKQKYFLQILNLKLNNEFKKGYKVIQVVNKKYYSSELEKNGKEYKINKITIPRKGDGPLTIFDNIDDSNEYLNYITKIANDYYSDDECKFKVFSCKYKLSNLKEVWVNKYVDKEEYKFSMSNKKEYKFHINGRFDFLKNLESNTILADEVILLEEV